MTQASDVWIVMALAVVAISGFSAGVLWGRHSERRAWWRVATNLQDASTTQINDALRKVDR